MRAAIRRYNGGIEWGARRRWAPLRREPHVHEQPWLRERRPPRSAHRRGQAPCPSGRFARPSGRTDTRMERRLPLRAARLVAAVAIRPGAHVLTVVCKATYELAPVESPLAAEQEYPNKDENHWNDDPGPQPPLAGDLIPFKPRADVLLVGHAFAPRREPVRRSLRAFDGGGSTNRSRSMGTAPGARTGASSRASASRGCRSATSVRPAAPTRRTLSGCASTARARYPISSPWARCSRGAEIVSRPSASARSRRAGPAASPSSARTRRRSRAAGGTSALCRTISTRPLQRRSAGSAGRPHLAGREDRPRQPEPATGHPDYHPPGPPPARGRLSWRRAAR